MDQLFQRIHDSIAFYQEADRLGFTISLTTEQLQGIVSTLEEVSVTKRRKKRIPEDPFADDPPSSKRKDR